MPLGTFLTRRRGALSDGFSIRPLFFPPTATDVRAGCLRRSAGHDITVLPGDAGQERGICARGGGGGGGRGGGGRGGGGPATSRLRSQPDRNETPPAFTTPPPIAQFYGHGIFSRDGRLLLRHRERLRGARARGVSASLGTWRPGSSGSVRLRRTGLGPHAISPCLRRQSVAGDRPMAVCARHPDFWRWPARPQSWRHSIPRSPYV
jgi:hypothetical protein